MGVYHRAVWETRMRSAVEQYGLRVVVAYKDHDWGTVAARRTCPGTCRND